MEVANNIVPYGSEIWAETMEVKKRANSLVLVQRTTALRIASAYRAVSAPAVLVIASTIPVDLLAAERTEIYKAKAHNRTLWGKHHYKMTMTKTQESGRRDLSQI